MDDCRRFWIMFGNGFKDWRRRKSGSHPESRERNYGRVQSRASNSKGDSSRMKYSAESVSQADGAHPENIVELSQGSSSVTFRRGERRAADAQQRQ